MHLSPDQLLVAAKVDYRHDLSVTELAAAIDHTESNIRAAVPIATMIYLEPDIRRSSPQ
jgi:divalent metal cation (Fe/Co/Zn/Cd) transporter